eukprot:TRINITY_DN23714_c0_g1_i1.p1 TRINITY_DN23714_c0_g1~~TRINITY_DN23714_c0_g1_i1.p1  ORF type:complete len:838 (-),score=88.87 TRINITY_DN23714_c0_g1_i1:293-2464(-)
MISNAFFTFLASYEQAKSKTQDDTHKDRLFNYGYIGKFNYDVDTNNFVLQGNTDSLYLLRSVNIRKPITFERSEINGTGANYASQIFDYFGTMPTINSVQNANGLVNGDRPNSIYSLYFPTGRQADGYGFTNSTQLRFASSFSADFKNHAIMVGVEYDQRNQSGYTINPIGLWERMRLLVNSHLEKTPGTIYEVPNPDPNGPRMFTSTWTYNPEDQAQIDKSLREMMGTTITDQRIINTDALNPEDLKLSMFSAADLIGNGQSSGLQRSLVDYYGYDYLGNKDKNSTSIDKFLNDKDANGNNTFHVGGFKPIYVAGYIQDKFDFRDIKFNVGVRVDRFDANQKVLKDKYLFHEAYTAGEKAPNKPENIKDNYVVYVRSIGSEDIIAYRNGDQWYNSEGKEVSDPNTLTVDGRISPYLKDPSFASKNGFSTGAFTDYKPQINVMPRLAFSFPISDVANFFAHYDVLTQRPSEVAFRFNPTEFYFFNNTSANPFVTNSNLKPTKTIDYELGYNQILNEKKNAAIKVTAFYRELRDQITTQTLNQAYPKTYYTLVNRDFGTVKGLSAEFDLRRTGGVSLTANYTLQFADGSGSNAVSGANLASSGQPNLRVTLPLDYDQRHNIVVNLDYRFGEGKDYKGPQFNRKKKGESQTVQVFQNMGANLIFRIGSGTPYTRYVAPVPVNGRSSIAGSLNGSNKPWQFRTDLRIDKNIELTWGKKDGDSKKNS